MYCCDFVDQVRLDGRQVDEALLSFDCVENAQRSEYNLKPKPKQLIQQVFDLYGVNQL